MSKSELPIHGYVFHIVDVFIWFPSGLGSPSIRLYTISCHLIPFELGLIQLHHHHHPHPRVTTEVDDKKIKGLH